MDYPIISNYDGKNEMVTPQSFANHVPDAFKNVERVKQMGVRRAYLIFYDQPERNPFFKGLEVVFSFHAGSLTSQVFLYKNSLIAIAPLGGPAAASLMEELSLFGVSEFVAVGSAGCIDERMKDKFVVVEKAIRDEGLSYHYLRPSKYVATDADLSKRLEEFLRSHNLAARRAVTWTNDAYYRETDKKVAMARSLGAVAVEMECASWCAVAKYRGFKFAQLLYFSDVVGTSGWKMFLNFTDGYYSGQRDMVVALVKDMIDENM